MLDKVTLEVLFIVIEILAKLDEVKGGFVLRTGSSVGF